MKNNNPFVLIFSCLLLLALPIIVANQYYLDDITRATSGATNWGVDGRPLSEIVMRSINFKSHISDLSPVPLLLGLAFLAFALAAYAKKNLPEKGIYALIPLSYLISPSTPEILSYKFDSLLFLISISMPLLAFSLNYKSEVRKCIVCVVMVIATFCTYQASVNLFIILALIEFTLLYSRGKSSQSCIIAALSRLLQLVIASVVYLGLILPKYFRGVNSSDHPGISSGDLASDVILNFNQYYDYISRYYFKGQGFVVLILFLTVSVICALVIILRKRSERFNTLQFVSKTIVILTPFLMIPMAFGVLLVLGNAISNAPRAYLGVGGICLYASIVLMIASNGKKNISLILPLCGFFYTMTFTSSFSNALKSQYDYTGVVINEVKFSATKIEYDDFIVLGSFPKSEPYKNSAENFPVISTVNTYSSRWMLFKRFEIEGVNKKYLSSPSGDLQSFIDMNCRVEPDVVTDKFALYVFQKTLVIDFRKNCQ